MTGGILFLAHRLPFPPDRGDKIRSHHILKRLADLAPVHVATFGETDADMAAHGALAVVAASHCLVRRDKPVWRAGIEALIGGLPVSLAAFQNQSLVRYVAGVLARTDISAIYVFSGQMGQYVPASWRGRLVVDLCDVDSAKFETYAGAGHPLRRFVHAREARLLRAEEALLAERADHLLLVSDAEADLLRTRLTRPQRADVRTVANGIDTVFFDPAATLPHADLAARPGPHFVFTGQMDYPPNIAAARRMIDQIMPAIRIRHPEALFHIVGRAPPRELHDLDGVNGARIWGQVPDVRPFLAAADLVVAPLAIARGVQNKVLEAMAMARPVVLSSGAATGIAARDGEHFRIADGDDAFAAAALALLADKPGAQAMGTAARRFVGQHMSWRAALTELPELIGLNKPQASRDAA